MGAPHSTSLAFLTAALASGSLRRASRSASVNGSLSSARSSCTSNLRGIMMYLEDVIYKLRQQYLPLSRYEGVTTSYQKLPFSVLLKCRLCFFDFNYFLTVKRRVILPSGNPPHFLFLNRQNSIKDENLSFSAESSES